MDGILQVDYIELALDDISPILALKSLETIIGPVYIYKYNSIIRGVYNQDYKIDVNNPLPLLRFEIAYSEGIVATDTIVSVSGHHIFMGRNDVFLFNGFERRSITFDKQTGGTRIRDLIFGALDGSNIEKSFAVYDEINRRYMLWIKTVDTPYPTNCFVYDIDRDVWWRYIYPQTSAATVTDVIVQGTIDNLTGVIDDPDDSVTISSLSGSQKKRLIMAMTKESFYPTGIGTDKEGTNVDAIPYESYIISRDFYAQSMENHDRVQQVNIEGKGTEVIVGYNCCYGLDPTEFAQQDTLPFGSNLTMEKYLPDAITMKIRFLIKLIGNTRVRWFQVFSKPQEFEGE
jgi:hypothetical protein